MFNNNIIDVYVDPIVSKRSGEAVRNQYDIILTTYDFIYHAFQSYETKCAIFTFDVKTKKRTLKVFEDAFYSKTTAKYFAQWLDKVWLRSSLYYNLAKEYFKENQDTNEYVVEID